MQSNIPIRNIYYMLAYTYQTLQFREYQELSTEEFDDVTELYTAILIVGIPVLLRGGLLRDYMPVQEQSQVLRGKIDISGSIKQNALIKKRLVVTYDEFSEDILENQLIKATLLSLLQSARVKKEQKQVLYGFLPYFSQISDLSLDIHCWQNLHVTQQNQRYQFILAICHYLYEEHLLAEMGDTRQRQVEDERQMSALYEHFVRAFYKKETSYHVSSPHIHWLVDDDYSEALPLMKTDVVLKANQQTLIIDTKFYQENMVTSYRSQQVKQQSNNLYQLFSYVMNYPAQSEESVGGVLLYAKTKAITQPHHRYTMMGKQLWVMALDLDQPFEEIKAQLLALPKCFFKYPQ